MDASAESLPNPVSLPNPFDLGRTIRGHRKDRDMTQAQLADAAGASPKWLSEVENGKPTAEIGKIMEVLGCLGLTLSVAPRRESPLDLVAHIDSFAQDP